MVHSTECTFRNFLCVKSPAPALYSAGVSCLILAAMEYTSAKILVNDLERRVPAMTSVTELLQELRLPSKFLAVELNRRVIPRGDHATTFLSDGDRIEIVTLVGGG